VVKRPSPASTATELSRGVAVLIDQLVQVLRADQPDPTAEPTSGPDGLSADIDRAAAQHGAELLGNGFTVDQVVRDHGDLCQAVTALPREQNRSITVDELHTFNRSLDGAIAGA
jgi:hypothetical protein